MCFLFVFFLVWFVVLLLFFFFFFFFNDTATTEIYTLSLHDALPIWARWCCSAPCSPGPSTIASDRKSTRLNSSHLGISYAVFCLKKKKQNKQQKNKKQKQKTKKQKHEKHKSE